MLLAPFTPVSFKSYILAEILTDMVIPLEDFGKVFAHMVRRDWDKRLINKSVANVNESFEFFTPDSLKWYLYFVAFLPYMWRMNQNLRKWLVYGHKLQAWNVLKYFILMMGPIFYIMYNEIPSKPKAFYYLYYICKATGMTYKLFWDIYIDWGLCRGTRPDNRLLRDNMKFSPGVYYFCMFFDVIGLYFWIAAIFFY